MAPVRGGRGADGSGQVRRPSAPNSRIDRPQPGSGRPEHVRLSGNAMASRMPRPSTVGKGRSRSVVEPLREHEILGDAIDRLLLEDPKLVALSREIQRLRWTGQLH